MNNVQKNTTKRLYKEGWRGLQSFPRLYEDAPTEPRETNHSEDVGKDGEKGVKKKRRLAAKSKARAKKKRKTKAGLKPVGLGETAVSSN